jgi:hypothetical protein
MMLNLFSLTALSCNRNASSCIYAMQLLDEIELLTKINDT